MALIACPECKREVSDVATVCPNCGYPIEKMLNPEAEAVSTSNQDAEKKTKSKKGIKIFVIVLASILVAAAIGFGIYWFVTADSRNYEEAVALYEQKNYSEALAIFETISDYEDSSTYIKDCKYELTVNAQFLRALANGLEARWVLSDRTDSTGTTTTKDWYGFIDAEYNEVSKFKNEKFEDKKLQKLAKRYIELLEDARGVVKYYGTDENTFWNEYNPIYDERSKTLKEINANYTIPVSKEKQTTLDDLVTRGGVVEKVQAIMDSTEFKLNKNEYGWKEYKATVKNTSDTSFSYFMFNINLEAKNGTVVETVSAYTKNWQVGAKHVFTFSTNANFDKIKIMSCNYD